VIVEYEFSHSQQPGSAEPSLERSEVIHAGDRHRWLWQTGEKQQIVLATPNASCEIIKPAGATKWSIDDWKRGARKPSDYWNSGAWIELVNWTASGQSNDYRMELFLQATYAQNKQSLRITRFEHEPTKPGGVAVLEFEFGTPPDGETAATSARFEIHPERQWAIASYEVSRTSAEGTTVRSATFNYPADDPKSSRPAQTEYRAAGPKHEFVSQSKLLRYEPWTVDDAAFDPEKLGIAQSDIDARYRAPWYFWCWGAMAPVALLGGIGLLVWSRPRSPAEAPTIDSEPAT